MSSGESSIIIYKEPISTKGKYPTSNDLKIYRKHWTNIAQLIP